MTGHRPSLDVLADLRRGRAKDDITAAMHQVIEACIATGKKGELTIKLTFSPKKVDEFETPRIDIADVITKKVPTPTVHPSTFFVDDTGNPVRNDPYQDEFPGLRGLPADDADTTNDRKAN